MRPIATDPIVPEMLHGGRVSLLLLDDPVFFLVQRAKSAAFNVALFVSALIVFALMGWWDGMAFLWAGLVFVFVVRFDGPMQISWQGPNVEEMCHGIENLLELARYQRKDVVGNWQRWTKNRIGWRRWLPKPEVQVRASGDTLAIRGDRDFISLLRLKF
jgi:hypothetical protein